MKRWTPEDTWLLRQVFPHSTDPELCPLFGCSDSDIQRAARKLGLKKTPELLARVAQQTRFNKGQRPWNHRRRGWTAGGRSAETRFKPGAKPQTWVPVGTEVRCPDGYLKRKVSDDAGSGMSRRNWKFVHVMLWEQHHGPVPAGHAVVFRDGNRQRIELDNLELISRTELMRRNSVQNLPEELKSIITARARLVRVINEVTREKQV